MSKPQILLLTHGGWGMSLLEGVKMVVGAVDFVKEHPLKPQVTFQEYLAEVRVIADTLPEGSLIITDMFGGTTTNAAAVIGREKNIKVISGLNAPLLAQACMDLSDGDSIDFETVMETGLASIRDVVTEVLKSLEKRNQ